MLVWDIAEEQCGRQGGGGSTDLWVGAPAQPYFPCAFSCTSLYHSGLHYKLVQELRVSMKSLEELVFLKYPKQSHYFTAVSLDSS